MSDIKDPYASIHYRNYLQLDKILDAQTLRSHELDRYAHDEMLFIVIHQVYELWFKQIIHETKSIMDIFDQEYVEDTQIGVSLSRLDRVIEIMELLVQQIRVLETLTPLDFLDFRNYLFPASGFQSFQFRKLEVALGLKSDQRITYNGMPYHSPFNDIEKEELIALENGKSLVELINDWLERTPFVKFQNFDFLNEYQSALQDMIDKESEAIRQTPFLLEHEKSMRLKMLGDTSTYYQSIFDEQNHEKFIQEGQARFSYKATIAALFIRLYRDEPILNLPNRLLDKLMDLDELLTSWRFRHAQMVLRMLGKKIGTGGSSGHEYLATTAAKHTIFKDLYNISTMLIPRSNLPVLPEFLRKELGFDYSTSGE